MCYRVTGLTLTDEQIEKLIVGSLLSLPTRITNKNTLGSIIDQILINLNVICEPDQNYSGNSNAKIIYHQVQYLILRNCRAKTVELKWLRILMYTPIA